MSIKLSSDELHQFKTAALAEQMMKAQTGENTGNQVPERSRQNKNSRLPDEKKSPGINYILHLNRFFVCVGKDSRLKSNHISLYIALFHLWNLRHFVHQFVINRTEVMRLSKIRSTNTYSDCMKWLHRCGYIHYQPAGFRWVPCKVSILFLSGDTLPGTKIYTRTFKKNYNSIGTKNDTVHGIKNDTIPSTKNDTVHGIKNDTGTGTKNDTGTVSKMIHFNYKQINNETESKQTHAQKEFFIPEKETPTLETTRDWFSQRGQTPQEARKFFYHYQAISWTLSGQPITNWQAAAAKWLENSKTFKHDKPGKLHAGTLKDYSKPL